LETKEYIVDKFKINLSQRSPFWIKFNRLTDLPQLFKELDFKSGAEIGVLKGDYSEILCQTLPEAKIYSIDPWVYYPVYKNFRRSDTYEPLYQVAKEKLAQYPNNTIIRKSSMEAVEDFEDESLDFVFIDADHRFRYVADDIDEWSKKVRTGGIIAGHDFGRSHSTEYVHVRFVVPAWALSYQIHPWFVLDAKNQRSWMWIK